MNFLQETVPWKFMNAFCKTAYESNRSSYETLSYSHELNFWGYRMPISLKKWLEIYVPKHGNSGFYWLEAMGFYAQWNKECIPLKNFKTK